MSDQHFCLICDTPIEKTFPDEKNYPDEQECWTRGLVAKVSANYGSEHDMDTFLMAICDDCINEKLQEGVIKIDNLNE